MTGAQVAWFIGVSGLEDGIGLQLELSNLLGRFLLLTSCQLLSRILTDLFSDHSRWWLCVNVPAVVGLSGK